MVADDEPLIFCDGDEVMEHDGWEGNPSVVTGKLDKFRPSPAAPDRHLYAITPDWLLPAYAAKNDELVTDEYWAAQTKEGIGKVIEHAADWTAADIPKEIIG